MGKWAHWWPKFASWSFLEIYAKSDITAHLFQVDGKFSLSRQFDKDFTDFTDESSVMTTWQLHTFKLSHLPRHHLKETLSIGHLNPWFVARDHPQLIDGGRDSGRRQKAWNCESSVICQSSHLLPSRPNAYHQSEAWNNEPLRRLTNIPVVFSTKASDCHWFCKHLILICTCADDLLDCWCCLSRTNAPVIMIPPPLNKCHFLLFWWL